MEKLHVVFDLSSDDVHKEMRIAPPYEWLVWFMGSSIGHSVRGCRSYLKHLRAALDGTPTPELGGNLYELVADATTATITDMYEADKVRTYPTIILYDLIERWLDFLETHGRDGTVKSWIEGDKEK